ncbi:MAG TPA: hypothetical protein VG778_12585, partial [Blastocatellia bacterium]|nr:hypothetical protein [Blastocatellia bacterium]
MVFQRSAHYNPTEDNIVRSQARLLRQRLQNYFESEGNSEPVILVVPKGGYTPEFVERPALLLETPASAPPADSVARTSLVRWLLAAIAALTVVVVFQSWLLFKSKAPQAEAESRAPLP